MRTADDFCQGKAGADGGTILATVRGSGMLGRARGGVRWNAGRARGGVRWNAGRAQGGVRWNAGRAQGGVRFLVALCAAGSPWLKRIGLGGSGTDGLGVRGESREPGCGFWLIVAGGGAETDFGVRASGFWMGGKWFRLLGLRGFRGICGWR
jgi:hypothetical protein